MTEDISPDRVLTTWFEDVCAEPRSFEFHMARWFGVDPAFDAQLRSQLGAACEHALTGGFEHWRNDAASRLALVVLLDQVTRNIHRGTARAFAGDARALALTLDAIDAGMDRDIDYVRRAFFYMPLEHAEDLAVQQRYLDICLAREAEAPPALRHLARQFTAAGREHLEVIARFGRFPHRNAALGRSTLPEEAQWLAASGRHWGQGTPTDAA